MKRKPTPAQIAARERFAEMARSGAFKKKAAKARKTIDKNKAISEMILERVERGESVKSAYDAVLGKGAYDRLAGDLYDEIRKTKSNPAKKTVSQKISQLTREGYPQKQAVAIALSEERAGKVKRNPITETLIYGLAPGETRAYMEDLLYDGGLKLTQAQIEQVLKAASAAGYHSFRIAGFDPTVKPDFTKALKTGRKRNPRASNPIVLVTDRKPSKRKANPVKPKRQRMLNISWMTAGGQRDMKSVPIDFVFTHYVGNVAERFFVRTENGQLIVSEYSTGGRIGQVPYTMRAAALNDRDAAKLYVGEMLSRIGAERFKAVVKKFDPIN